MTADTLAPAATVLRTTEQILSELRRRTSGTETGRYAAIALDELAVRGSDPPTGSSARVPPRSALTHAAIEPLIPPVLELARDSPGKLWLDVVHRMLDLVPVPMRKPSQILRLALEAPRAVRPVLLADYWHLLMAGGRHDPARILPIALDVWGGALSSPPRLLAETLYAVRRRQIGESPWRVGRRPVSTDEAGEPTPPLEVLAAIPDALDFVRGWGLVRLRPLLEENGLRDRALALARRLSNRYDARKDTLRRWREPPPGELSPAGGPRGRPGPVTTLSVPGDVGTEWRRFQVYVGQPAPGFHPVHFQAARIREEHGAVICGATLDQVRMTAEGYP